ncbi:hypothetical protein TNCV_2859941 [Trichonephila clavipes]|nr:hypothetical protein TNCV_2859941 [Trichonephila clavipes]
MCHLPLMQGLIGPGTIWGPESAPFPSNDPFRLEILFFEERNKKKSDKNKQKDQEMERRVEERRKIKEARTKL